MCKKLETMMAVTPVIKNLDKSEYMNTILNGKDTLDQMKSG